MHYHIKKLHETNLTCTMHKFFIHIYSDAWARVKGNSQMICIVAAFYINIMPVCHSYFCMFKTESLLSKTQSFCM